jgi:hypothetical protein
MPALTTAQQCLMNRLTCRQDSAERAFNKLARIFAAQLEALRRYRTGEQRVAVQHVTVKDGGQAIVGSVTRAPGGGGHLENEGRLHERHIANAREPALHRPLKANGRTVQSTSRDWLYRQPLSRSGRRRAERQAYHAEQPQYGGGRPQLQKRLLRDSAKARVKELIPAERITCRWSVFRPCSCLRQCRGTAPCRSTRLVSATITGLSPAKLTTSSCSPRPRARRPWRSTAEKSKSDQTVQLAPSASHATCVNSGR